MSQTETLPPPITDRDRQLAPVLHQPGQLDTRLGDRRDLSTSGAIRVDMRLGGIRFANALEMMEWAKLMAASGGAVPNHLRGNPGACLRVVSKAIAWGFDPWDVGDKTYFIKDKMAHESQLVHAVIEAHAPLQHMLECDYDGEGDARTCTITGHFTNGDVRDYTSPPLAKIKRHSPLWETDPDQQLFYFASRSWARKWCPNVLMGIYTREEIADMPDVPPTEPGLRARLTGGEGEGHRHGHAATELDRMAVGGTEAEILPPIDEGKRPEAAGAAKGTPDAEAQADKATEASTAAKGKGKGGKGKAKAAEAEATEPKAEPPKEPTDAAGYMAYARGWMATAKSGDDAHARWDSETDLRDKCAVSIKDRRALAAELAQIFPAD